MSRARSSLWLALALTGCASRPPVPALADVDRVRASQSVAASTQVAPESYAQAERARLDAYAAQAAGDDVAATLRAERAIAAYADVMARAREARAKLEMAAAQMALEDATARLQSLVASRARLEADVADLEKVQALAQQKLESAPSRPGSPEREQARRVATGALLMQARLICGAARLVSDQADGLQAAESTLASLVDRRNSPASPGTAIDAAGQCRAACLDVLVRARRAAGDRSVLADQLFSELAATGNWSPRIDERGVVVDLRGAFVGAKLTDEAGHRLADLGQVAATHPSFALQVVVHDATPQPSDVDGQRAKAAVSALVAAGAAAADIAQELAGVRAPIADPNDARARSRNDRLEIVFVGK